MVYFVLSIIITIKKQLKRHTVIKLEIILKYLNITSLPSQVKVTLQTSGDLSVYNIFLVVTTIGAKAKYSIQAYLAPSQHKLTVQMNKYVICHHLLDHSEKVGLIIIFDKSLFKKFMQMLFITTWPSFVPLHQAIVKYSRPIYMITNASLANQIHFFLRSLRALANNKNYYSNFIHYHFGPSDQSMISLHKNLNFDVLGVVVVEWCYNQVVAVFSVTYHHQLLGKSSKTLDTACLVHQ